MDNNYESLSIVSLEKKPVFNHIIDNVYLGDIVSATNESIISDIDIIINISNSRYKENDRITYHHIDIDDNRNENIVKYVDEIINIIKTNSDKKILIHCMNSVSRSVSLVLFYLMSINYSLKESFDYLKSKRSQYTKPNIGFAKQLIGYEKNTYGQATMSVGDFQMQN
jgi:protein-tyrosine phosphatase